jgi:uncharacterized protein (TIGR02300 family)
VVNSKWGTKRACLGCGKPFYDMQRNPIVCPSCEAPFEIIVPSRVRRQRAAAAAPPTETAVEIISETENTGEGLKDKEDVAEAIEDMEEPDDMDA